MFRDLDDDILWLLILLVTWEAAWWTNHGVGGAGTRTLAVLGILPAAFVLGLCRLWNAPRWPLASFRRDYLYSGLLPVVAYLGLGTLAANLLGGVLIGLALAWTARHPGTPPEVRLLVITGYLGGLTTFSTFSAEVVNLLARRELLWGFAAIGAHLVGSLAMTALGIGLGHWLFSRAG